MNILLDISHPAHVHLLKNVYFYLVNDGHKVYVVAKPTNAITKLLNLYHIPYIPLGGNHDSLLGKALLQISNFFYLWWFVVKHKIEIGVHGMTVAWVSRITKMHSILTDDDDDDVEPLYVKYAHPYANVILSPKGTKRKSQKTIYYPSYHELSYLYPKEFTPDVSVLRELGIIDGEPYFILRFNAFKAHHDVGVVGLTIDNKRRLIEYLKSKGKVFITTERNIDDEFKQYQLKVTPDKAHSLMFYATMLIGDSQTMTSEAAVLGTPAIRCNTFVGRIHYLNEEENEYGLTYGFLPNESEKMFEKIDELLSMPNLKREWQERRERMLAEKIDYAKFLTWFIENYPASVEQAKHADKDFWMRFK
ncbi:MAG: DUF354 domain-containing protein [Paludibacteraceae bacterium]|nr:DUF354 domain-containing protein [Paludibacteraceae bacterium]